MNEKSNTDFLMSIAFSVFGMLLIFGLGFVFPSINPYVVVKWIVIVAAVVFVYALLSHKVRWFLEWKRNRKAKVVTRTVTKVAAKKTAKK